VCRPRDYSSSATLDYRGPARLAVFFIALLEWGFMQSSDKLSQGAKANAFRSLHAGSKTFVIPNPWNAGTALLLEQLQFEALATTSSGFASSCGLLDRSVPLAHALSNVVEIAACTDLPVSADLENGFGDAPEVVGRTILLAAEAGAVGGSIEDSTGRSGEPMYCISLATDRIRAAVEAARSLPFPFTLTARAENYVVGEPNLSDAIKRLQAYQEAGADVLYAPCLTRSEHIVEVMRSVDRPVNVLIGFPGMTLTVRDLEDLGVKRISVGGALARAAMAAVVRAATELRPKGTASNGAPKEGGTSNLIFFGT
jgi:2-methylisocitrate lyase-like PEP mutase family enzyme